MTNGIFINRFDGFAIQMTSASPTYRLYVVDNCPVLPISFPALKRWEVVHSMTDGMDEITLSYHSLLSEALAALAIEVKKAGC